MIFSLSVTALIAIFLIGIWLRDAIRDWKKQKATEKTLDVLREQNEIAARPADSRDNLIKFMRDGKL
jgi:hypothetical protein